MEHNDRFPLLIKTIINCLGLNKNKNQGDWSIHIISKKNVEEVHNWTKKERKVLILLNSEKYFYKGFVIS